MRALIFRLISIGPWRGLVVLVMLALAAFSGHPGSGVVSGALDRVLFDTMARVVAHPSTRQVVVVNLDEGAVARMGPHSMGGCLAKLLGALGKARSVTLDLAMLPGLDYSSLQAGMRACPRTVLVEPNTAVDTAGCPGVLLPLALSSMAAACSQRIITTGHYGVVSGFVPYSVLAGTRYAHVALDALRVAGIEPPLPVAEFVRPYAQSIRGARTEAVMTMLPTSMHLTQYSYSDVLQQRVPKDAFDGKVVFVGNQAWGGEGMFQISSLNSLEVTRSQLDALIADAVASGNLAREASFAVALPIYLALALGVVLICVLVPGRALHLAVLAWGVLIFAVPLVMLVFHIWLPLGLLPVVCLMIYGFFAWERHARILSMLRGELHEWWAIAAALHSPEHAAEVAAPACSSGELANIKAALLQVRSWQKLYVDVINQLPYPVFLAMDGHVAVWNAKAAALTGMDAADQPAASRLPFVQVERLVAESVRTGGDISREIEWEGRVHMLRCAVLSSGPDSEITPGGTTQTAHLVCVIDFGGVKELFSHDERMLRHIAHDLRSPLTAILSLIDRQGASAGDDSLAQSDGAFLSDLRRQASYSLRIAKDFMQLSRAERLGRVDFEPVALSEVAEEAIDQNWLAAEQKGVVLCEPVVLVEDTLVAGNADMLMRAVVNVVDNAIKYSSSGAVVSLAIGEADDGELVLSVTDDGIGMTDETVRRLFEPFFQAEPKADGSAGVGLGLPFVKAVIERHGGRAVVRSTLGGGTVIALILPRISAEERWGGSLEATACNLPGDGGSSGSDCA
ncbi:ATP-binding protein [Burkholderia sp. BE17]|uniref:ATP-binding protein n=1 Tax=Burkholderia sp. BE17 TaxID=2656644 RepID=UPI00128C3B64|nr:ATP-binding protein [Burkholderia sp. BE17]MPV70233.1 CHASE2 domain-containing protein [Burkholderia sp. BE17]